jgi:hypothetical protein
MLLLGHSKFLLFLMEKGFASAELSTGFKHGYEQGGHRKCPPGLVFLMHPIFERHDYETERDPEGTGNMGAACPPGGV